MIKYKIRGSDWLTFALIIVNFNHSFIQPAPGFLLVLWANIFLSVNMHNTWLLYKTSSHYSMIFLYLLTTFLLLRSLFSTTTKYSTQPNLTTTTFLPFLKHYLSNTTNPSSTLVLRPVKNYNFSRDYSNVVLLVGSFFVT